MFRILLSYILITLLVSSNVAGYAIAEEIMPVNSLDSLPYGEIEESESRKMMLEGEITSDRIERDSYSEKPIVEAYLEESTMTLLAMKSVFEGEQKIDIVPLTLTPSLSLLLSGSSLLSTFLAGERGISGTLDTTLFSPLPVESSGTMAHEVKSRIEVRERIKETKTLPGVSGAISYQMMSGTIIMGSRGEIIDTAQFGLSSMDTTTKMKAKAKYEKKMKNRGTKRKGLTEAQVSGFEFGLSGMHLIFSKPVMLQIDAPNMSDGVVMDIMTLHAGDTDFHTGGLSLSANTLCNTDGTASLAGSQAIVKNGKVTFYTCGASSFTMNPTGGIVGSNDLRLIVGDCGQFQLYYNGAVNMYTGTPPATGCNATLDNWIALRIGATTYWSEANNWTTASTTGVKDGNTYSGTTILTRLVGTLTYTLTLNWKYLAPNKFFTIDYSLTIPAGNTNNIRFYLGNDSMAGGDDANDVGYTGSAPTRTIGVYDNVKNQTSAIRYLSGPMWTAEEVSPYGTINTRISGGTDFNNTIQKTAGDLGFGVNWNFGTTPGVYTGSLEWRTLPYITANVVDLVPGIGLPEGPLTTGYSSRLPITVTNAGNLASSGVHTIVLTLPANISAPSAAFVDSGWSCGAQVATTTTCTRTTNIASLATETFYIPVVPAPAAGGTTVTFNISLTNPGDSNTTNNTAFASNAVVAATLTFAPGGMTGATLWLKANGGKNCATHGCTITTWNNSGSIVAANAVTGLGIVTYDSANLINYNPSMYFNNASLNTNSNLSITTAAASIFTATKIGAGGSFLIGPQTAVANALDWSTSPTIDRLARYAGTLIYSGANLRGANTPDITSTSRAVGGSATNRTDGLQTLTNAAVTTAFAGANVGIGRSFNTNSTLANVGEVIIYPAEIIGAGRNKIESYLAIKYGITLDQTTAQNYTLSNNAIAWNASLAGIFSRDIAGIARDDVSSLSQTKSQSANNTGDIIVSTVGTIGSNYQSLVWANDGTATGSFTSTDSPTGYSRITREWQFQEKNVDIGNVKVSYPASSFASGATSPMYMLVDSNSVFATGSAVYTGTLVGSNWEFIANIADMAYITFAKSVPTDTTPPTILSNSITSGTLAPIGTFPITVTYADTGSTINTGSLSGAIYAWDATGATWDIINIASPYLSVTSASTSTGIFQLVNLPFGKYRFDFSIADVLGNKQTVSYTYSIDAIEWTVSSPSYGIGSVPLGSSTFGTGELILTVKTVGAGFDLTMLRTTDLTYITDVIPVYSGTNGWGYSQWNGTLFPSTITPHGTSQSLASVVKNINPNGQKNTFTYRVKYGVNPNANTPAGDYSGNVKFDINLTY